MSGLVKFPFLTSLARDLIRAGPAIVNILGIYGCFLTQGLVHEALYSTPVPGTQEKFKCPLFLVSCVCISSGLVGLILVLKDRRKTIFNGIFKGQLHDLLRQGFLASLSYIGAMMATNYALTQVNYPTQVLIKSAKTVPVIVGGWLLYRKTYPLTDYAMVAVVTLSLIFFQFQNMRQAPGKAVESVRGFLALSLSLMFDGMTGPRQDHILARYKIKTGEMMLLLNLFAAPMGFLASAITEGRVPWQILGAQGAIFVPKILAFIACGAAGQVFVVRVLRQLGSLPLTIVTTSRKFLAILLSVIWFGHPLTAGQWCAVAMIFAAAAMKYAFGKVDSTSSSKKTNPNIESFEGQRVHRSAPFLHQRR